MTMKLSYAMGAVMCATIVTTSSAQAQDDIGTSPVIDKLESCTQIEDNTERLACFDREVGAFVGATNEGEVRVVDSDQITQARKKLYGYSIPDAGIFEAKTEEEKDQNSRLVSTITRVRQVASKEWHFWIEEGNAKWRIKNNSVRARAPKVGQSVEFKPATMGTYWIRIDGRKGVRGNRIG